MIVKIDSIPTRGRTLDHSAFIYDFCEPILLLGKQAEYDLKIVSILELKPADKVLEHLSHRLTNKLLHAPTQALNLAEGNERAELQAVAARLFHLHSGE